MAKRKISQVANDPQEEADPIQVEQTKVEQNQNEISQKQLLELAVTGIIVTRMNDGVVLYVNAEAERMFRGNRNDWMGRPSALFYMNPDDRIPIMAELRQSGYVRNHEIRLKRTDGETFWALLSVHPVPFEAESAALLTTMIDITERKRAEDAARLDEIRTQTLLELNQMAGASLREIADFALEAALKLTDSALGYLAFTNEDESVLTMYAWSKNAMAECAIADKPVDYPIETTGLWGEAVRQRRPIITNDYAAPSPLKRGYPEGHIKLERHLNTPVFDGNHIIAVIGVGNKSQDYTEADVRQLTLLMQGVWQLAQRQRDEADLREREVRLQGIATNVPGAVFQFYATDKGEVGMNYASNKAIEIFGLTGDLNTFFQEFTANIHEEDRAAYQASIQKSIVECAPWDFEGRYTKPTGEMLWFHGRSSPSRQEDRTIFNGIIFDVTERKQSEMRQRLIMETMPVGILITEPTAEGKVIYANPEFARMRGTTTDEIIGKPVPDLYYNPEDRVIVLKKVREQGFLHNYPVQGKQTNGEAFWAELSIQPIEYGGARVLLTSLVDITQRKAVESEREQFTLQLNTAAAIATQVSSILDPDKLLKTVIPLIKENFGLYYVHVYTLDEKTDTLNLRAGYGEPGRIMLERGHSIPLSREQSLVATAARTKELVHVPDVTKTPNFLPNPLLSDTRTEVAVPLVVGDQVLGVFDIQHDVPHYFAQSYLDVFTTLAGQIAVALQNAHALTEVNRQRAFYDGIITNLPVGVWAVDKQFTPLLVNPAGRTMMGREIQDRDGGAYVESYDVINVETGELFDNTQLPLVKAMTQGGIHSTRDAGVRHPDGTIVPMLINAAPLNDADGVQTGAVVIFVNATEQRAAENALAERVRLTQFNAEIGAALARPQALSEMLKSCADIMTKSLDAASARIWTLEDAENILELQASAGTDARSDNALRRLPLSSETPIGNVALQRQSQLTDEVADSPRGRKQQKTEKKPASFARHPLLVGERVVGVAEVSTQHPLKAEAQQALSLVASSIALGIDRKKSEMAAHESAIRFQNVVNALPLGMHMYRLENDGHLVFTGANPTADKLLGVDNSLFIGKTIEEAFPPLVETEVPKRYRAAAADGVPWQTEQITYDEGKIQGAFEVYAFQTGPNTMAAGFLDVTERMRSEAEVRISEQRFRDVATNIAGWVWEVNSQGQYTYCSEKVTEILGYSLEEVLGKTPFDFMLPEEVERIAPLFSGIVARKGNIVDLQNWNLRKDGTRICLLTNGVAIVDENSNLLGYRGVDTDITERTLAEVERTRLASILENTVDLVSTSTPDGQLTYLNPAGYRLIGWPEGAKLEGRKISDLHPDATLKIIEKVGIPTAMETGYWKGETAVLRSDGVEVPVEQIIMTHRADTGKVQYMSTIIRDLTETKQARASLEASAARIQRLLDTLPLGMHLYRLEPDGQLILTGANPTADTLLGMKHSDLIGKTVEEAFPMTLGTDIPENYRKTASTGIPWQTEQIAYYEGQVQGAFEVYAFQIGPNELGAALLDATERARSRIELEKFATQLRTASDIAGRVNAILDPGELLNTVIPLLKERFDLYYIHVYALEGSNLTLRAGYGEPGRVMLERGHSIPLDREASLVATAARTKQLVHVPDVTVNPNFMPNPLLPDTKTEVAVPLIVGGEVLGVFDIQHDLPDYFTESYLDVFTTLAGQIATALQNARIIEETERQRALYDSILKNLPVGVWAVDQQFNVLLVNDAGRAMMGREVADAEGGSYTEAYDVININTHELYDNSQLPLVKTVTQGGVYTANDAGVRWPDGTIIPQMINSGPLLDPQGKQIGGVVIFADITEQRRIQQEIERQRALYNSILKNLPVGVWAVDQQFNVLLVNDAGRTMMGREVANAEGGSYTEAYDVINLLTRELYDNAQLPLVKTVTQGGAHTITDAGVRWPDGTIVPMLINSGPILDPEGRQVGGVVIFADATQQHLAQMEIEQLLQETSTRLAVSQALAGDLDEDQVLDILVQQTGVFPDARITLNLIDVEAEELTLVLARAEAFQSGLEAKIPIGMRFTAKNMPMLHLIGPNQSFISQNLSTDERLAPPIQQIMARQGALSMAIIPMTAGTEWLGAITVAAVPENYFDQHKLHMYQTVAEQGANALRTARLRGGVRRSLAQTSARLRVSQELSSAQTEEQVLNAITRVGNFYPETQISVFILDQHTADSTVEVVRTESFESNLAETVKPGMRFAASEFPMVALIADGKTFVSGNLLTDKRVDPTSQETARQLGEHSLVVIPMNIGNEQLGFLTVGTAAIDFFDERKMFLYESLAEQGATALQAARLRAELQVSVARFEGFANNTSYGFGMLNMNGETIYANPALYRMIHADPSQTKTEFAFPDHVPEDLREQLHDQIRPALKQEGRWSGESALLTIDGQRIPTFEDHFLIRDAAGTPQYVAAIVTDITERKAAEERIADQLAILETSPNFIGAAGMDTIGTYINPAGLEMTGYTEEEFYNGLSITKFQPDLPPEALDKVIKEGLWVGESTIVNKNGIVTPVMQSIGLRKDSAGNPRGFFTIAHDVSEAHKAQVAIAAERDRAQRYLETVGSLVIALDTQGNITLANRAYCETFGYTEPELVGKNWFDFNVAEAPIEMMKERYAQTIAGEIVHTERYEGRMPTKTGEIRTVSWYTALLRDETGAVIGVLSSGEDITERLKAEAERTRLSAVLEATSDFVGIAGMDGYGVYFNRGAREMIGLSLDADPHNYNIAMISPERELARTMNEIIPAAMTHGSWSGESVIKAMDGREIPTLMTIIAIKDAAGNPQYLANVSRDISDIRAAQEQVRLLAAIVESADEAILSANAQGIILSWNPAAERISGYTAAEMIGKSATALTPPDVRGRVGGTLQRLLQGERVDALETQWLTKEGRVLDVLLATSPIYDASGQVTALAGMATDITARKRAEVERERFTTQLSTAAEIAQSVGAILDTDELLNTVIPLLKERFGLYHAHVYVLDTEAKALKLRSGYGQVGKIMQQQGHKIALDNERSLVARAARSKAAVVSNDVTQDPDFMPNLLLPETQSEVAVPFMIGEEVLGVFDVQAAHTDFFTEADLNVFRTLAGQIANAFQSARLFEQQRQAEVAQREAAERIRAIFEAMTEGITVSNTLGQIEDLNEATLHLHKYGDRNELLGRSQMELFARNDWANASRGIRQALENGRSETAEYKMLCKDGTTFDAEQNSALLRDADGNPAGFVSITRDITERKRAEEALRLTRASVDETDAEIFWFGEDGRFTDVNDTACKVLEYTREELLKMEIFDIDIHFPRESLPKILAEVRESGMVMLTSSHHTKKGKVFPVEISFYSVEFGKQRRYFLFAHDISERLHTEEERERFTTQLRTAAEVSMQVGAILDPQKLLELVVPLITERFNLYHVHVYIVDEETQTLVMRVGSGEIGKLMREQTHAISLDREQSLVAHVARTQKAILVNDVIQEPGFMPNPLLPDTRSELAVPLIVSEKVLGVLDVQDDEAQRFTQNDMDVFTTLAGQIAAAFLTATSYNRVLEVDRLKGEFLANMSHELRTPLNSILGYTEVMLMGIDGDLTPEMSEDVQAIFENGQQLLRLINDILDLTKIEAGRMVLSLEPVDVVPLLEDSKVNNQGLLLKRKTDVEIVIEANDDLPIIVADRVRLGQVLNNLVSNAVKFTEKGYIYLRAFKAENHIFIEVEDTGMGISKEDQAKIFQRFRQVDGSSTRRAEGTGLGLAISRSLVQMHGWELTLTSESGKGSKFSIDIPLKNESNESTL